MRGTIGQQRTDSACYIQWRLPPVQMTKAEFKRTLIFDRRSQAFTLSRFKDNWCYTVGAPLVNKAMYCSPVVLNALRCTWQAGEP